MRRRLPSAISIPTRVGFPSLGVDQHHVGDVDRTLTLNHPAGLLAAGRLGRALVALDDVKALDVHALLLGLDAQDLAGLAAVLTADDDHLVVASDACGHV